MESEQCGEAREQDRQADRKRTTPGSKQLIEIPLASERTIGKVLSKPLANLVSLFRLAFRLRQVNEDADWKLSREAPAPSRQ